MKRSSKCGFNYRYFTCSKSHYTKQKGFLPFSRLPTMPKPSPNSAVTTLQVTEMRKWREQEFGQIVRQVTVRNKSTKDNLPINCYVENPTQFLLVDFQPLETTNQQIVADSSVPPLLRDCAIIIRRGGGGNELRKEKYYTIPPSQQTQISSDPPPNLPKIMTQKFCPPLSFYCPPPLLIIIAQSLRKQSFVVIKPGYPRSFLPQAPFYVGRCTKDLSPSERQFEVAIYTEELLLPSIFMIHN